MRAPTAAGRPSGGRAAAPQRAVWTAAPHSGSCGRRALHGAPRTWGSGVRGRRRSGQSARSGTRCSRAPPAPELCRAAGRRGSPPFLQRVGAGSLHLRGLWAGARVSLVTSRPGGQRRTRGLLCPQRSRAAAEARAPVLRSSRLRTAPARAAGAPSLESEGRRRRRLRSPGPPAGRRQRRHWRRGAASGGGGAGAGAGGRAWRRRRRPRGAAGGPAGRGPRRAGARRSARALLPEMLPGLRRPARIPARLRQLGDLGWEGEDGGGAKTPRGMQGRRAAGVAPTAPPSAFTARESQKRWETGGAAHRSLAGERARGGVRQRGVHPHAGPASVRPWGTLRKLPRRAFNLVRFSNPESWFFAVRCQRNHSVCPSQRTFPGGLGKENRLPFLGDEVEAQRLKRIRRGKWPRGERTRSPGGRAACGARPPGGGRVPWGPPLAGPQQRLEASGDSGASCTSSAWRPASRVPGCPCAGQSSGAAPRAGACPAAGRRRPQPVSKALAPSAGRRPRSGSQASSPDGAFRAREAEPRAEGPHCRCPAALATPSRSAARVPRLPAHSAPAPGARTRPGPPVSPQLAPDSRRRSAS